MRPVLLFDERFEKAAFASVLLFGQRAAHQLEAQEKQVGVRAIGFAVVADRGDRAAAVGLPDRVAAYAELARKAGQARDLVERRAAAAVDRQHIHQVEVPVVEAVDVVAPLEILVVLARIPETGGGYAVDQAAGDEYRQIEIAAIPRNDLRHVSVDSFEEALDRHLLGRIGLAYGEQLDALVVAQHAGNHHDALQVRRQEIAAGLRAPLLERHLGDLGVGQVGRQVVQAADSGAIRDRFEIEGEDRRHRFSWWPPDKGAVSRRRAGGWILS